MDFNNMFELQIMLFAVMIIGAIARKKGMITDEGKQLLTDLVINITLPCVTIRAFAIEFSFEILKSCILIFVAAIGIQMGCWGLSCILYVKSDPKHRSVLQYGTICSNAGTLGNPIAEGVFGAIGSLYASIYLIPQRIFMWSIGLSYFTKCPDAKSLVKKVLTHPCIIAVFIGLFLMITQIPLPGVVDRTVDVLADANTALSMLLIGTVVAGVAIREILDRAVWYYSGIRLLLIPFLVWICCRLMNLEPMVTNVSVILGAMPCANTTVILAAKYDADEEYASKCVMLSTLLSMITIPIWSIFLVHIVG